jgi:hypothetical protein
MNLGRFSASSPVVTKDVKTHPVKPYAVGSAKVPLQDRLSWKLTKLK